MRVGARTPSRDPVTKITAERLAVAYRREGQSDLHAGFVCHRFVCH